MLAREFGGMFYEKILNEWCNLVRFDVQCIFFIRFCLKKLQIFYI